MSAVRNRAESRRAQPPLPAHRYVVVKFRDQVALPDASEILDWLRRGSRIPAWEELETLLPEFTAFRMFGRENPTEFANLVARARLVDPTYDPPKLENFIRVQVPTGVDGFALAKAFEEFDQVVEQAYFEPPPSPLPVDPTDDDYSSRQLYLGAAPDSVDAIYAWDYPGGDGAGQAIVDIEHGWVVSHEDLSKHTLAPFWGLNMTSFNHGAAVLGIVAAEDNDVGCVGIAPNVASVRTVGAYFTAADFLVPEAIEAAIATMAFGDVLLLELQGDYTPAAGILYPLTPIEANTGVFAAIRLATALGIVVIEAAGDGHVDLETVKNAASVPFLSRSLGGAGFLDSGAIVVGCASKAEPHVSLDKSCYGTRVDCFAWGEQVQTLWGDGTKTTGDRYTDTFEDTSAAAAIIAGVALVVQGLATEHLSHRLNPWQMRELLSNPDYGTELDPGETELLGVMPNLRRMLEGDALKIAPDVYVRDHVGDDGDVHDGAISASPDIIVIASEPADPQASWGEGSGMEDSDSLGSTVEAARDHFVYVRVRNRGGTEAVSVEATVYWAEPASLLTPDAWTLIGSTTLTTVPTGDVLTVSDAIPWPSTEIPGDGHYCFVATLEHERDPEPLPPFATVSWEEFEAYIRRNNNVTWRNFNVVTLEAESTGAELPADVLPGDDVTDGGAVERELEFVLAGAHDRRHAFELEIGAGLPRGSTLQLELPRSLALHWRLAPLLDTRERDREADRVRVPIHPWSSSWFEEIPLEARARHRMRLIVRIPRDVLGAAHRIFARQLYRGREVGRVTWKLVTPRTPRRSDR